MFGEWLLISFHRTFFTIVCTLQGQNCSEAIIDPSLIILLVCLLKQFAKNALMYKIFDVRV